LGVVEVKSVIIVKVTLEKKKAHRKKEKNSNGVIRLKITSYPNSESTTIKTTGRKKKNPYYEHTTFISSG